MSKESFHGNASKESNLFQSHVAADDLVDLILWTLIRSLQTAEERHSEREHEGDTVDTETGPHHTDELDELKADGDDHRVLKVSHGTDHLVVAGEEFLDQASLIWGGPTHT